MSEDAKTAAYAVTHQVRSTRSAPPKLRPTSASARFMTVTSRNARNATTAVAGKEPGR
jgi:hypothetical protein